MSINKEAEIARFRANVLPHYIDYLKEVEEREAMFRAINSDSYKKKKCSRCGENKYFSEFHRNAKSKDGYLDVCKQCLKIERMSRKRETNEKH